MIILLTVNYAHHLADIMKIVQNAPMVLRLHATNV